MIMAAIEEMTVALNGGDWGYGALGALLNNYDLAREIVNFLASV